MIFLLIIVRCDSGSISFSAPTFVATCGDARAIGHGATKGFGPL
jgi:hypothetical protein